ncbi:MAG TPA: antitoxin Xre/MbcA/ParS toxin-binding domain-containing protein [Kofleriaceae bacterium]|nr:antitoxin Xre/MbcA/ParS toxin-binding domain-containing protein [Kofleriaceae bacterium]
MVSSSSSSSPRRAGAPDPTAVLVKALVRAAERIGLTAQKDLAEVLGVSPPTISRLVAGSRPLDPRSSEGERALLLLRIWRSLDALVGGDDGAARDWFQADNRHLGGVPAELVRSITGLVHVADYLDAMRGKV